MNEETLEQRIERLHRLYHEQNPKDDCKKTCADGAVDDVRVWKTADEAIKKRWELAKGEKTYSSLMEAEQLEEKANTFSQAKENITKLL